MGETRRIPDHFERGEIAGIIWKPLKRFEDSRGWLLELFRDDEVLPQYQPAMAYISLTEPGIVRGPHEHVDQADYFCFFGPSDFRLYLWDIRRDSPTYGKMQVEPVGTSRPMAVVVPPGVVHAYRNIGKEPGLVFNAANRLYKGWGRTEPVDEFRHEGDGRFVLS
jgi:dTDP-4-dehydrorhamnose 3,5-epimerase